MAINKRYIDFVPKGGKGAAGAQARTMPKKRMPEIELPKQRMEAESAPIQLMPADAPRRVETVRRVRRVRTEVVRPAGRPATAGPVSTTGSGVAPAGAVPGAAIGARPVRQPGPSRPTGTMTTEIAGRPNGIETAGRPVVKKKVVRKVATGAMQGTAGVRPTGSAQSTAGVRPARAVQNVSGAKPVERKMVQKRRVVKKAVPQVVTRRVQRQELDLENMPSEEYLLNDPLERPVSEFADLEELAQEIEEVTRGGVVDEETQFVEGEFSLKQKPQFGVVEDFQPRFLNTEVEKRPLSGRAESTIQEAELGNARVAEPKTETRRFTKRAATETANIGVNAGMNSAAMRTMAAKRTKMEIPKAKFINQNKVAKRPLSKTMYIDPGYGTVSATTTGVEVGAKMATRKGQKATKKSEKVVKVKKNAKNGGTLGMVLAVFLTIILGAVVGVVAYLLLPK